MGTVTRPVTATAICATLWSTVVVAASATPSTSSAICPPPAISQPTPPSAVTPTSDDGRITTSPTPDPSCVDHARQHKRARVGALAGTIAALIFLGVLICLILRWRRTKRERRDVDVSSLAEQAAPRPPPMRKLSGPAAGMPVGGAGRGARRNPQAAVSVDEEHRIIRMSTRHWPRPFVPGAGEGYRDSAPHGQLRVVNPDLPRPTTPRKPSDAAASFLRKHREALAAFVFPSPRPVSTARTGPATIAVADPSLSRECVVAPGAASTPPPSSRSIPSTTSLPTTPPEDPFLTPPDEPDKQLPGAPPAPPAPAPAPSPASLSTAASRSRARA